MIQNKETVIAIADDGKQIPYQFGKLKTDFISGKLKKDKITISHVYVKRLNQSIKVFYSPTKGFRYEKM